MIDFDEELNNLIVFYEREYPGFSMSKSESYEWSSNMAIGPYPDFTLFGGYGVYTDDGINPTVVIDFDISNNGIPADYGNFEYGIGSPELWGEESDYDSDILNKTISHVSKTGKKIAKEFTFDLNRLIDDCMVERYEDDEDY